MRHTDNKVFYKIIDLFVFIYSHYTQNILKSLDTDTLSAYGKHISSHIAIYTASP